MFEIGQVVKKENYTQAAVACNKAEDRHIEKKDGQYVIVPNPVPAALTTAEKVTELETKTGLTRPVREMLLADGNGVSEYVKTKAQEIEVLAATLRGD